MPTFRRSLALRPVKSEKHEGTWSFLAQNASTKQTVILVKGIDTPSAAIDVETGSTVKWIYVEFNLNGVDNSSGAQVFHWYIWKNPSGVVTSPAPNVYNSNLKRHILKRGMEMLPDIPLGSGGTVQTKRIFTLKIPPRLRRIGDNDKIELVYISTSASGINFCGITVFKDFS